MAHLLTRMSVLLALFACHGCATRGNLAVLEGQLRRQEDQVHHLNGELKETQQQLQIARTESEKLRGQLVEQAGGKLLPEQSDVIFRASSIKFNAYLTCGVDRDGQPGDELLSVLLVPQDAQGHTIRLPGALEVEAIDLNASENQRRLGQWKWPLEAAGKEWHSGFLAEGYHLEVPWQAPPGHSQITVHAKLTTPDGRAFDATQVVNVRVAGSETPRDPQAKNKSAARPPSPVLQTSNQKRTTKKNVVRNGMTNDEVPPPDDEETERALQPAKRKKTAAKPPIEEEGEDPFEEKRGTVDTSDRFRSFDPPRYN